MSSRFVGYLVKLQGGRYQPDVFFERDGDLTFNQHVYSKEDAYKIVEKYNNSGGAFQLITLTPVYDQRRVE